MVVRTVFPSTNPQSLYRQRKAGLNARAFRGGDSAARLALINRLRGYLSLSVGMPWPERLKLANAARARNKLAREAQAKKAAASRPYLESTRDL